jgi:hypothetical protein
MDTSSHLQSTRRRAVGFLIAAFFIPISVFTSWSINGNVAHAAESTIWSQLGLDIDGGGGGDLSGHSVAMSSDGSRIAVGEPSHDSDGKQSAGRVRVYRVVNNQWVQIGADILGVAADDQSGLSVAISSDGSRVAIGAPNHDSYKGHVRVYNWNGTSWEQLGLDIDGKANGKEAGTSVAMSADGSRVAIGAPTTGSGSVHVYNWNGTSWSQVGLDIDGEADDDKSGSSVAISSDGTRVAIGAPNNQSLTGHVRVYNWNGTSWSQLGDDIDGEATSDISGSSVAMSSDGTRVAIGAPDNDGAAEDAGHVRVYNLNGTSWEQLGDDINGEARRDKSGSAVAMSANGSRIAIGAPNNDGVASNAGHVRVYTSLPIDQTPDPDDENSGGDSSGGSNTGGNNADGNSSGSSTSNDPKTGDYSSTVGGTTVGVDVTSDTKGGVTVKGNGFTTTFQSNTSGKNNELFLPQGEELSVRGNGFKPRTRVKVMLPKSNTNIGTATVSDDGSFVAQFIIPRSLRAGTHVLTLQGQNKNGKIISIQTTVKVDKLKKTTVKKFRVYSNKLRPKLRRQINRIEKQNPAAVHCQGFVRPSKINNLKDIARATKRAKSVCSYLTKRNKGIHSTIGFSASTQNRRRVEVSYR